MRATEGGDLVDPAFTAKWDGAPRRHPRFLRRPSGPYAVWQVMGIARVAGVDGDVDLDVGTVPR